MMWRVFHRLTVAMFVLAIASGAPAGCKPAQVPASPNFAVLVDISGTWLDADEKPRNELLLRAVGEGVVEAAQSSRFAQSTIRYHAIGDTTLYEPPFCIAVFEQRLLGGHDARPPYFFDDRPLREYLSDVCVLAALNAPDQNQTQVTAALVTAVRSMSEPVRRGAEDETAEQAARSAGPRRIIVLSDLKEEPISTYNLAQEDFRGVDVLIVYRALREDNNDVGLVEARISRWRTALEQAGAHVYDQPDSGVTASIIARFLAGELGQ